MQCPLLAEARVKQCRFASASRAVPLGPASRNQSDRCHSPAHASCPNLPTTHEPSSAAVCPYLEEPLMLYCTGAPSAKYIPYSETSLSRCGDGRHRYCDVFLAVCGDAPRGPRVNGILVPDRRYFTPNHFWLDPGPGNVWHIGIDALLAAVLHPVDHLAFVSNGAPRPSVVITSRGIDLTLTFPAPLAAFEPHTYLRANPKRLTEDPYQRGWLFEGRSPIPAEGLRTGPEALAWMQHETDRLSRWTHQRLAAADPTLANDGGQFSSDLFAHLTRHDVLNLHQEFFSPFLSWEPSR